MTMVCTKIAEARSKLGVSAAIYQVSLALGTTPLSNTLHDNLA